MYVPPASPRDPPLLHDRSWSDVLSAYAIMLAIPVLLWLASYPLVGAGSVLGLLGLRMAVSRARASLRRLFDRCCIVFRIGENIRITITRTPRENSG